MQRTEFLFMIRLGSVWKWKDPEQHGKSVEARFTHPPDISLPSPSVAEPNPLSPLFPPGYFSDHPTQDDKAFPNVESDPGWKIGAPDSPVLSLVWVISTPWACCLVCKIGLITTPSMGNYKC